MPPHPTPTPGASSASDSSIETPGVVIGNHCAKYDTKNPAVRWLTDRFLARLGATFGGLTADARNPLEVGAGEGVISEMLHTRFGRATALDLPDAGLRAQWRNRPGPRYLHGDALALPFTDRTFDLVVCVEVLEHLADPRAGLAELARVGTRDLVLSVPREPLFRGSNLVGGRYVPALGNTPGHLNHWSARAFRRFVGEVADIRAVATPFPWTIVWATLPESG
jgi:SAM-dependent methyltransferase